MISIKIKFHLKPLTQFIGTFYLSTLTELSCIWRKKLLMKEMQLCMREGGIFGETRVYVCKQSVIFNYLRLASLTKLLTTLTLSLKAITFLYL